MNWPVFGGNRRARRGLRAQRAKRQQVGPNPGLETLEQRVLLSAVGLGDLPQLRDTVQAGGSAFEFNTPAQRHEVSTSSVSGTVFNDVDGDGFQDPNERAVRGVTVFADLDGDGTLGDSEPSVLTSTNGVYQLHGLPAGDYTVRLAMPDGYMAAAAGSAVAGVSIAPDSGVGGLTFGLVESGFDLGLVFSDVSMPASFQTGTRVTVPVIVTNRGTTAMPAGDVRLRVWVSQDRDVSTDDIRLAVKQFNRGLAPGESVKLELSVKLPDSLGDFFSYLAVDAVGGRLRNDLDRADNRVVSPQKMAFHASAKPSSLNPVELNFVQGVWDPGVPFGGLDPGDGFVGIADLNVILGNWNPGRPPTNPGGTIVINIGGGLDLTTGNFNIFPPQPVINPGLPGSISGTLVHDTRDQLADWWGWLWPDHVGLEGWTVYLDQNRNNTQDAGEQWTLTAADGSYSFADLPTNSDASGVSMLYYAKVDVPQGWRSSSGTNSDTTLSLDSGEERTGVNFGFFAEPRVGQVIVEGGYLARGNQNRITAQGLTDLDGTIDRVVFYFDAESDGKADDILGVDTDGSDGYSITTTGGPAWSAYDFGSVYAVAQDSDGHLGAAVTDAQARTSVDVQAGKSLVYRDTRGNAVTVELHGRGTARVSLGATGLRIYDLGDVIEVAGVTFADGIELIGTTGRTRLSLTMSGGAGGGSDTTVAGMITGSTPLGQLLAPHFNFNRGIHMTGNGAIRSIKAASVNGIDMPGQQFANGLSISAGKITGDVALGSPLRLLDAGGMIGVNLNAPSAQRILVKNNYRGGSLTFTDSQAEYGLGLLRVGKRLERVRVRSVASIDTVSVKTMDRSSLVVESSQGLLAASFTQGDFNARGAINRLTVAGGVFADSFVAAWRIGQVRLEATRNANPGSLYGLIYERLGGYQGPGDVLELVNALEAGSAEFPTLPEPSNSDFVPFTTV